MKTLEPSLSSEVQQLVGLSPQKEELLKEPGTTDQWFVASRTLAESERIVTSSTWLYGISSSKWALKLNFAALPARPIESWPLGNIVDTELIFYPGLAADRVTPRLESATSRPARIPEPPDTITALLQRTADTLALNPWRTRLPFFMLAQPSLDQQHLIDSVGNALPWQSTLHERETLTSLCAGHPTALAGEWNGHHLKVFSAADGASWFNLNLPSA